MEAQDSSKVLDKVRVLNGVLLKVDFFFCFMIFKEWTICEDRIVKMVGWTNWLSHCPFKAVIRGSNPLPITK